MRKLAHNRWQISFSDASGRRIRRNVAGTKREAQAIEAELRTDAQRGRLGLDSAVHRATLEDLFSLRLAELVRRGRKDTDHPRLYWGRLLEHFGPKMPLVAIGPAQIEGWRAKIEASGGTANRHLAELRRSLRLAERHRLIDRAPFVELGEERGTDRPWTIEEWRVAMDHAQGRTRLAFILLRWTGLRLAEACGLLWDRDIHLDGPRPWLTAPPEAKTRKSAGRPIPIEPGGEFHRALLEAQQPSGPVLVGTYGRPWDPNTAASNLGRWRRNHGIAATTRGLRHTYLTDAAARAADIGVVADLAGHSQLSTTRRYVQRTADHLADALGISANDEGAPLNLQTASAKMPVCRGGALRPTKEGGEP